MVLVVRSVQQDILQVAADLLMKVFQAQVDQEELVVAVRVLQAVDLLEVQTLVVEVVEALEIQAKTEEVVLLQ